MRARPTLAAAVAASWLSARAARAQTLGDDRALAPDAAELDAIERAWRRRETERLFALRHRVRLIVEAGASVTRYREHVTDAVTLRRDPSLAAMAAVGGRYALTPAFEVHLRGELVAPLPVGAIDNGAFARVATTPCDATRRYDLAPATAAALTLDAGFRVRAITALSPFYVGGALRLTGQVSTGSGEWAVRCVDARGATVSEVTGSVDASAAVVDVGASLETGYRFGERESWDVGIRMTVQALGTNAAGLGGAQFFVGWSP